VDEISATDSLGRFPNYPHPNWAHAADLEGSTHLGFSQAWLTGKRHAHSSSVL